MKFHMNQEDCRLLWPELRPLIVEHYAELRGNAECHIDEAKYDRMQEAGLMAGFTIRDEDNELVGYAAYDLYYEPYNKGDMAATQDGLFIREDCRLGSLGARFLRYTEDQLKAKGVKRIYQGITRSNDFGRLLIRMGYTEATIIYAKELGVIK